MNLLHIGFSNTVSLDKIVAIISPETSAAKKMRATARSQNSLIDCTMARKLRSMILTDSQYIFLSSIRPEALLQKNRTNTFRNIIIKFYCKNKSREIVDFIISFYLSISV